MAKRIGKGRKGTRHIYRKPVKQRGKVSIRRFLQKFQPGDKVLLKVDPSCHKGLYFPRFHGRVGVIEGKRGSAYEVKLMDRDKPKIFIVSPVHLRKV
jgi:large subunit ribosomal protein L21e